MCFCVHYAGKLLATLNNVLTRSLLFLSKLEL